MTREATPPPPREPEPSNVTPLAARLADELEGEIHHIEWQLTVVRDRSHHEALLILKRRMLAALRAARSDGGAEEQPEPYGWAVELHYRRPRRNTMEIRFCEDETSAISVQENCDADFTERVPLYRSSPIRERSEP